MSTYTYTPSLYQFPSLLKALAQTSGPSPSLDLRFALDKSLTAYRGPTPSFSRASTGSYFDGNGVLRYANVNLLTYSENFSDASWAKNSATVTNDSIVSPDGKTTADTLTESSANATHFVNKSSSTSAGTIYTSSIYAKAGTRKYIDVTSVAQDGGIFRRFNNVFDLETGTWQSTASLNSPANTAYSITSVGNGWYRISSSILAYGSTHYLVVYLSNSANPTRDAANDVVYTGNGTGNLYIWGAQLEASSTVGTYCPTTSSANSAPRFNHTYNGTSWVSRGLLLEEQRTNSFQYSEDLSNAYWAKVGLSISANSTSAPDGNTTADKVVENASSGIKYGTIAGGFLVVSGTTYTFSAYAKDSGRYFGFATNSTAFPNAIGAVFNLTNGTISNIQANTTASIQSVGNGWYRCIITGTANASTTTNINFGISNDLNQIYPSYTGNGSSGYFLWGLQMESGSFPTSYIGTTNSSVVRSADVCQITGGDFSGFWNGTEGTIVGDFDRIFVPTGTASALYTARDSANNNAIYYYIDVSNDVSQVYASGASATFDFGAPVGAGISNKIATAYKANDFAASRNGSTPLTDTSGAVPSGQTLMEIGSTVSANYLNGHIARLRYYRKRLPNETLQLLSEPDPTLNLQFALNKTLTPVAGPAPSFSRASTGTFFNASGVLTSASINTPRFGHVYSGGQWVSRGLLIEEQRTNLLNYSEDFSNAYWFKFNSPTLTANTSETTSPDGINSATKVVSGTTSETDIYKTGLYSGSGSITFSIYAKAGTSNFFGIGLNGGGYDFTVNFDLSNGTYNQRNLNGYTGTSISVNSVGNGWYRCSLKANNLSVSTGVYLYCCANSLSTSFTTSGNSNYLFGAQLEVGSFATSYIKSNSGSSVTRSADVCQITGTSFGWMWNQGEGSVASEFDFLAAPADRVSPRVWYASDGAYTNGMWVQSGASDGFYVYQSGSSQAGLTATALGAGVSTKVSSAYKLNDFAASFNGASALTDTTGNVPTVNRMEIGFMSDISGRIINGHIAKLIYYPARLTNTKLQQLST